MSSSFHQSLLPSTFDKPGQRRRQGQAKHHFQEIELSSTQRYQPPLANATPIVRDGSGFQQQQRPIFPPSSINHHSSLRQDNPNTDTSCDLLSHGFGCLQCVRTQEVGIVETCGAFEQVIGPGLYCGGVWPVSVIVVRLSLKVQQLDIEVETKTKDDVFVVLKVSVQFRVIVERAYDVYYRFSRGTAQIQTYVYDVIRSTVPSMELDEVFASKTELSDTVFSRLQSTMKNYGYEIVNTLVASISPNDLVKYSMNEVNASKRLKEATPHKAEAEKIGRVKQAEAHAETLHLHGVGIAKQRSAIAKALQSSVIECSRDDMPTSAREAMDLLLVSQYLDTLVAVGADQMIAQISPSEVFEMQKWR